MGFLGLGKYLERMRKPVIKWYLTDSRYFKDRDKELMITDYMTTMEIDNQGRGCIVFNSVSMSILSRLFTGTLFKRPKKIRFEDNEAFKYFLNLYSMAIKEEAKTGNVLTFPEFLQDFDEYQTRLAKNKQRTLQLTPDTG